ncbi:MAG: hypothetical protein HUK40_04325 [Desulfobacter sp.]|nr:hypothetical protein [Desulfobacter sp.]
MSQLDWDIKDIFMAKGMVSARMTPRIVFNPGGGGRDCSPDSCLLSFNRIYVLVDRGVFWS